MQLLTLPLGFLRRSPLIYLQILLPTHLLSLRRLTSPYLSDRSFVCDLLLCVFEVLGLAALAVRSMQPGAEDNKEECIPEPETRPSRLRWVDLPSAGPRIIRNDAQWTRVG